MMANRVRSRRDYIAYSVSPLRAARSWVKARDTMIGMALSGQMGATG
jgi:hypothetical protein